MKILHPLLTKTEKLLLIIILILTFTLIYSSYKPESTNNLITDISKKPQTTITGKLNDSLKLVSQSLLIAETQKQMHFLESNLQTLLINNLKIKKIQTSLEYKDSINMKKIPGNKIPTNIEKDNLLNNITKLKTIDSLVIFPLHFNNQNQYLKLAYTVISEDSSIVDSLSIVGKGHLVIGETGKWYQRKNIVVGMTNENPYFIINDLKSVTYKPKQKLQLSAGRILVLNKQSSSFGVRITAKRGIFSFSLGYKLY